MNFTEAMEYLDGINLFREKKGLLNIRELMRRLGNPQNKLKFIHVAGTNGKGSVVAMVAHTLTKAGFRTGRYISPFVDVFNERICVDETYITNEEVASYMDKIKAAADRMFEETEVYPTRFELLTALAFLYFYEKQCNFVVLEVGLGGRLDSTNVIEIPLLAVIMQIGLDHQKQLGNSLTEIAAEKCGIIKKGGTVICYRNQQEEVMEAVRQVCKEQEARLVLAPEPKNVQANPDGNRFELDGFDRAFEIGLAGEYQVYNAAAAAGALLELQKRGVALTGNQIQDGIETTRWIGRFETLAENPRIVADGGHNRSGVEAFCNSMRKLYPNQKKVLIMGMMHDKDYEACIRLAAAACDILIGVHIGIERALSAEAVAQTAAGFCPDIRTAETCRDAIALARKLCGENGIIFIAGSLYLVSEARHILKD